MKIEDKAIQILNKKLDQIKPEIIKKDETILGITGTYDGLDTSDGTLQSQDMVEGTIGYSNFEKVVGTMPNFSVNNLAFDNVVEMKNNGYIRIREDMNNLINTQKAYVKRTEQLNVYITEPVVRNALGITENMIKKDVEVLDITGTYVSNIDETNQYDTLLAKSDSILGNSGRYEWLEYIQSDGHQYIDTGFIPDNNTKIEVQFEYVNQVAGTTADDNYDTIIGSRAAVQGDNTTLVTFYKDGCFSYGSDEKTGLGLTDTSKLYTIKIIDRKFYIKNNDTGDFEMVVKLNQQEFDGSLPLYLFAENQAGSARWNSAIKLHYCKIYTGSASAGYELARYFIPVKNKATQEICLYDRVSDNFYVNRGTGTFIAGEEKSSEDLVSQYSECVDLSNDILSK